MEILKRRRFASRIGISIGKLSLLAIIAGYFLILTPFLGFLAIFLLAMAVLLTFGLIFIAIPNFGDYFGNTTVIVEQISNFSKYNPYILGGAIILLVLALALTSRDLLWKKGQSALTFQAVLIVFAVLALICYYVFPLIIKGGGM